jgi:predicted O-methyltransferase YrrM
VTLRRRLRPLLGFYRSARSYLPARPRGVFAPDVASSLTEAEANLLAELARGKVALELGSWFGRSTIAMASTAERVHAIDSHGGDAQTGPLSTLAAFRRNVKRYGVGERVVVHVGNIEDVAPVLAPASFDVVFVDGLHTKEAVERDASLLMPLVRAGGAIAFHDYGRYDVTEVVDGLGTPERVVDSIAVLRR